MQHLLTHRAISQLLLFQLLLVNILQALTILEKKANLSDLKRCEIGLVKDGMLVKIIYGWKLLREFLVIVIKLVHHFDSVNFLKRLHLNLLDKGGDYMVFDAEVRLTLRN